VRRAITDPANRPPATGSDHELWEGKTNPKLRPRWRRLTADSRVTSGERGFGHVHLNLFLLFAHWCQHRLNSPQYHRVKDPQVV